MPQVLCLLEKHKIQKACFFGSVFTKNFNESSDVDFLVSIQEILASIDAGRHLWDLTYELEELLNRKVDLITERSLRNPYFVKELNETKFPIYG